MAGFARHRACAAGRFLFLKGDHMPEIRIELPDDEVRVLDGYCSGTGKGRTDVIRSLLRDWSASKLHESIMVCRVAGVTPMASESDRSAAGKVAK